MSASQETQPCDDTQLGYPNLLRGQRGKEKREVEKAARAAALVADAESEVEEMVEAELRELPPALRGKSAIRRNLRNQMRLQRVVDSMFQLHERGDELELRSREVLIKSLSQMQTAMGDLLARWPQETEKKEPPPIPKSVISWIASRKQEWRDGRIKRGVKPCVTCGELPASKPQEARPEPLEPKPPQPVG